MVKYGMHYYEDVQYIARVNKDDTIQDTVERWEAHKKGLLHRALTITIFINESVLLQKRKHPVFDSVYDMTISTHQKYVNGELQDDEEALFQTLERELHIKKESITKKFQHKGNIVYQAADPKSDYIEHEVCHIYTCGLDHTPTFDPAYAYGIQILPIEEIIDQKKQTYHRLAPWVQEMMTKGMV